MKVYELINELSKFHGDEDVKVMLSDMSTLNFEVSQFVGDDTTIYIDLHNELNNNIFTYSRCQ